MKTNQLIIIGGGYSIKEGIRKGLIDELKGRLVCGINYSYKYFDSTYLVCLNYNDFYDKNRRELVILPLILTTERPHPSQYEDNTIVLPHKVEYRLAGILALKVGIELLREGELFLLGYDFSEYKNKKDNKKRPITHFYQGQIEHRGIGKAQYYNYYNHAKRDFESFAQVKKVKIYNVSLDSQIDTFPKISYDQFFKMLDNKKFNQDKLRSKIRQQLGA